MVVDVFDSGQATDAPSSKTIGEPFYLPLNLLEAQKTTWANYGQGGLTSLREGILPVNRAKIGLACNNNLFRQDLVNG